ncbi:MAG: UvrB/UvrC motif-containing protein, partial [Myxococcota bacterium]
VQAAYNSEHGIVPATIEKAIFELDPTSGVSDYVAIPILRREEAARSTDPAQVAEVVEELKSEMLLAAENLEFEKAAQIRDRIVALQARPDRPRPGRSGGTRRR